MKNYTLNDLIKSKEASIKTGPFGTQLHASDYVIKGTPVINVRNIGYGTIKPDKLEYISEETVHRLSGHILKENDIVFGRKGAVDRHIIIKKEQNNWFQGSDCIRLRINSSQILPKFVSNYFLTSFHKKWMLNQCSHGSIMASLNQDIVSRITLKIPPLIIQQKITTILSTYNNLIENNTRRIKILEEMAQRIYKEWFVDFKYPGHEDDKLVDSELGKIPEGWEIKSILKIPYIRFLKENISKYEGFKTYYATADVRGTDFVKSGVPYEYHNKPSRAQKQPIENSIWFARMKDSYKIAVYSEVNKNQAEKSMISSGFAGFTSEKQYFGYLYSIVSSKDFDTYKNMYATGATQVSLNNDGLSKILFTMPTQSLILKFSSIVNQIIDKCLLLRLKNNNLRQTRDLLLPKLISGKIDVSHLDIDTSILHD